MSKKVKVTLSVFSAITFFMLCFIAIYFIKYAELSNLLNESLDDLGTKSIFFIIAIIINIFLIFIFNIFMWQKDLLFKKCLTPEQAAERKRIKQERRKARLQGKLDKIQ